MVRATCPVCPRSCTLDDGHVGACHARGNVDGSIQCLNYGHATSIALDPVEKKPFARWQSGKTILSIGSYGCNLSCPFCQNHTIAQVGSDQSNWRVFSPEEAVHQARALADNDCIGIALTYNEPLISYEYIIDIARLAHNCGLLVAVVTNGVANADVFDAVLVHIDAINIDLKGFSSSFYAACGMEQAFDVVKRNIASSIACKSCHVEVTSLIVPTLSTAEEMEDAARWLGSLDVDTAYHISQYHPAYRFTLPPIPNREVRLYAQRAQKYLNHVFIGNM